MRRIAAADGCKDGWVVVEGGVVDTPPTVLGVAGNMDQTMSMLSQPLDVMAIDIPIGFATAGHRAADHAAKRFLGPRQSSVFFAPARPVVEFGQTIRDLSHGDRATVSSWAKKHGHHGIGAHAFGIFPKMCDVDAYLKRHTENSVHEVHPEVCWMAMADEGQSMAPKSSAEGILQRIRLVERHLGEDVLRQSLPSGKYSIDDLLDALAGFWTARRIALGTAKRLPEQIDIDPVLDREIAIWY